MRFIFAVGGAFLLPSGRFLFRSIFLPLYGKYLWLKSRAIKAAPQKKDRFLIIFTNRYLIHAIILLIGTGVAFSNIMAYESKEDYGQNALVYKLTGVSDSSIIQDTDVMGDQLTAHDYQDQGTFIEGNAFAQSDNSDSDNVFTDQTAATQGDLALVKPDFVNTQEAKSAIGAIQEYVVSEGDTISRIAAKYGISVNTILWANNLSFSSYVKPGQKLVVPTMTGVIYKVVRGDTLSRIAQKFNISADKISEANGLTAGNLTIGNSLVIPGGVIIETTKPRTVAQTPSSANRGSTGSTAPVTGTGTMMWPSGCYRITQYFKGWRHTGVDIACAWGTPLHAADSGRVSRVQYGRTGYGYNVIIDHGRGIQTLYGHMSSIDVQVGDYVEKGDVIGKEGSTGRSTGPHCHFEVRINGVPVNPLSYIR